MKLRTCTPTHLAARLAVCLPALALAPALLISTAAKADVPPDEPPEISITSPDDGATFDGPTASVDVVINLFEGTLGIAQVSLNVDGETVATDTEAPYDGFMAVELGEGMHELVAVVRTDLTQDDYNSAAVNVVVFAAEGSTGSESGATGGGGDEASDQDSGGKCAAVSSTRLGTSGAMTLIGLFCVAFARRRRQTNRA